MARTARDVMRVSSRTEALGPEDEVRRFWRLWRRPGEIEDADDIVEVGDDPIFE